MVRQPPAFRPPRGLHHSTRPPVRHRRKMLTSARRLKPSERRCAQEGSAPTGSEKPPRHFCASLIAVLTVGRRGTMRATRRLASAEGTPCDRAGQLADLRSVPTLSPEIERSDSTPRVRDPRSVRNESALAVHAAIAGDGSGALLAAGGYGYERREISGARSREADGRHGCKACRIVSRSQCRVAVLSAALTQGRSRA
jgi:hypothetical protein